MKAETNIRITKANGDVVPFDRDKLRNSLERSGAGETLINEIITEVEDVLYERIPTKAIYRKAFSLLRRRSRPNAARYKLKRAIFELGPTGYPFEQFVGELLKHQGYDVQVGVTVQGHCVTHEVDVVAEKEDRHFMVECKFHSDYNRKCRVQVPLYIQSRFLDVKRQWEKQPGYSHKFHQGWVVTNTQFSEDAIRYGNCMGLKLISWDYPKRGNLKERIDASGLHPITSLTTLTRSDRQRLLSMGKVLCMDLCDRPGLLSEAGIKETRHRKILDEARTLCNMQGRI